MKYAKDWDKSARRYAAWWDGELLDRCMIAVRAPKMKKTHAPAPSTYAMPTSDEVLRLWTDPEWLYEQWTLSFEETYFAGDAFPDLWMNLGPSGLAGYCKGNRHSFIQTGRHSFTVWYDPSISDWRTDFPQFDEQGLLYQKTLLLADELSRRSNGDYIVSFPDTSGNLDALAGMRGNEQLMLDMMDEPETVVRASAAMQDMLEKAVIDVYSRTCKNGQFGSSIGWLQVWAPGIVGQMQCDMSVMLSPEAFVKFTMPELERQCDLFEYPLYHFDGHEQTRHLDALLSLEKLRVIQWTPVDGQPSPLHFISTLKRIQQAGKSLYMLLKPSEVAPIMEQLSSRGLHIAVAADSPDDADELVKLAERLTHD